MSVSALQDLARTKGLALLWLAALGLACSHRVDEPAPDPAVAAKNATATATTSALEPTSAGNPYPGRCIKPTPDKPARQLVGPNPDPNCPPDPEGNPKLAVGVVRFPDAGSAVEAAVEIADKDKDRMRGLMYRKALGESAGMLFVFDDEHVLRFWMKNTCIPLDMIFIAEDGVIVGIEENAPTLNEDTYTPNCPAKYVLEMNAGWARKHGVKAGQKAAIVR
jgi:uncharacterized membrane protein (UPF0127 family)